MKKIIKRLSFRTILFLFGTILVMIVAIPSLYSEVQRPWQELDILVNKGKIIITDVQATIIAEELEKMNQVALNVYDKANDEEWSALTQAFNMMLLEDRLLSKNEIQAVFDETKKEDLPGEGEYDYQKLAESYKFWQDQFKDKDDVLALFTIYKNLLIQKIETAELSGFEFDDTYIMTDVGSRDEPLLFLIDGSDVWWDATYPGMEFDVEDEDCPYFRDYLDKKEPGFDTDPKHYHYGIFPKFTEESWGTFFSVWYAIKQENGIYNNFAVDIKADTVKSIMLNVGIRLILSILIIFTVIIFTAIKLSKIISEPIYELDKGMAEIGQGRYNYEIPFIGSLEFHRLIENYNKTIRKLKQRINMKSVLEKMLSSKELAEQIAEQGFTPEGEKEDISIIFTDKGGFSTITQALEGFEAIEMLNHYLWWVEPYVGKYDGFTDKFIGDAIVAIFGMPKKVENHALNAICCAIGMQLMVRKINAERKRKGLPVFEMRIGINSGEAIVGTIGSATKVEYTAIGEPVNMAQRMESNCKIGEILISENTYQRIKGIFIENVYIDESPIFVKAKGYSQPVPAYRIRVANVNISKNPNAKGIHDFYIMELVNHNLKSSNKLSVEEKKKYSKFVKIEL